MKKLLLTTLLLLALQVSALEIQCFKYKGRTYPVPNSPAAELTAAFKVKTCSAEIVQEALKVNNSTMVIVAAKPEWTALKVAEAAERRVARMNKSSVTSIFNTNTNTKKKTK